MKNNMQDKKLSPLHKKILLCVLTIVLVGGVFGITYYLTGNRSSSQYIDNISSSKIKLDKQNKNVCAAFNNIESLNVKNVQQLNKIKNTLDSAAANVQLVMNDLQKINPPSKYNKQYKLFVQAVELNKKVIKLSDDIIAKPNSPELQTSIETLAKYVSECTNCYNNSKLNDIYVSLPSDMLTLPDRLGVYAMKAYGDFQNKSSVFAQYQTYFNLMDDVVNSFENTKSDLNTNVKLIDSNSTTFDSVYSSIENKLSKLSDIKTSYNSLPVPPKAASRHEAFNKILNAYSYYCQDFKTAMLLYEESFSDSSKLESSKDSFKNLEKQYNKISSMFSDYLKKYNSDKTLYTDINNI